ncbi:MAG: rod shape-determining protein MreC [Syntrophomonadaceae bacterium]
MFNLFNNRYFWLISGIIIVLLIIMNLSSSNRQELTIMEKWIRETYTPLQSGVSKLNEKWDSIAVYFRDKKDLQKQVETLARMCAELSLKNQMLRESHAEAERLREMVGFIESAREIYTLVPARVIARSPNSWYQTITIDQGSNSGIAKDMAVISPKGLVGRVGSVSQNSAQVNLISDREVAVGAVVQETRDTSGIVEGLGSSELLRMINIPYYSGIKEDDKVITSGLSEIFPKGIDIGTVVAITREPNGLLLSATIRPTVELNKLEEVLVITEYREPEEHNGVEEN